MRALTSKQKELIRKWVSESKHKDQWESFYTYDIQDADDLSNDQWDLLEKINDTEILWQEVNNFILDLTSV